MNGLLRLSALILGGMGIMQGPSRVWAAEPEIEARLGRLERIIENQSGAELLLQMQQLQGEMQALRGMVEQQGIEIERLKRQQRDQFLDLNAPRLQSGARAPQTPNTPSDPSADKGDQPAPSIAPEPAVLPVEPAAPNPSGIPALPQPETAQGDERALYTQAFNQFKERRYPEAKAALAEYLRRYPQGSYADGARYWLAETEYALRDYPAALAEYERLIQQYPASTKAPGALLKIGLIHDEQRQPEQARSVLERLIRDYPNAPEAKLARDRLQRAARSGR
ncbi:tol-pal system protein YbgF [Caldichromatium japonicum]|uniref:Cell division coordinator CpoB n=1 Tax=Caldichromatium japonicum TaxID=2699430 RepID=A0A6G7VC72_9GAMM|nr:tol-pal system protein YbgF [Caldichromatium japonicum]QIK37564.1 tol-pal system protein YbgF [Caldichromatium japonicum]